MRVAVDLGVAHRVAERAEALVDGLVHLGQRLGDDVAQDAVELLEGRVHRLANRRVEIVKPFLEDALYIA